ncbi:MAG: hypothetical protein MPJ02_03910 [Nitrosopumilus sp.]|nr:hypothetical protein [Nitrosopumilus sp.]MDA7960267.1 hypothetical protein [Nitrosopumilus sp.]MDA7999548.1 hypothetical protein [Nitrosopumilus sp.]
MEFPLEIALNIAGFLVGLAIGLMSLAGYRNTGSPTLLRLSIAFLSISAGFFVIWAAYVADALVLGTGGPAGWVVTLGAGAQAAGYFFIAFSHSIKSFLPRSAHFRGIVPLPLLLTSAVQLEHVFRSLSFIFLAYGAIETALSCIENKSRGAAWVAAGLALLALGEFLGWYSFVFPGSLLYAASMSCKIAGLAALFVPVSRVPLGLARLGR